MYDCFSLVLMVTRACNLRCTYCYTGAKSAESMDRDVGQAAIRRAVGSTRPDGVLELGFFGGEPLLEADRVFKLIQHAITLAAETGIRVRPSLTTNGTQATGRAWELMTLPAMQLTVSHDGLPEVHDRHRRRTDGRGTSAEVMATIGRLQEAGKPFGVAMVVRPDNVAALPEGIAWLRRQGVRRVTPSLDVWTRWDRADAHRLSDAVGACAEVWREGLPHHAISWFDQKAARLAGVPINQTARCGFGDGEIAVAPSGNLYPCERLIGEDGPDNAMRLCGHATDAGDFAPVPAPRRSAEDCGRCAIESYCSTTCRCSNYVRTGDVARPDGLLCLLDRVLYRETSRVLRELRAPGQRSPYACHISG